MAVNRSRPFRRLPALLNRKGSYSAVELEEFEKRNLLRALETCRWKISGAKVFPALIGLPPSTVSSRIKALGIRRP